MPPSSKSKGVGYKCGKKRREVAKEVHSKQRSKSLSRTMGIVHRRHEHILEAKVLATQQTVKKIKRYPYSGPQLKVLRSETQPIGKAEGINMSIINKQTKICCSNTTF